MAASIATRAIKVRPIARNNSDDLHKRLPINRRFNNDLCALCFRKGSTNMDLLAMLMACCSKYANDRNRPLRLADPRPPRSRLGMGRRVQVFARRLWLEVRGSPRLLYRPGPSPGMSPYLSLLRSQFVEIEQQSWRSLRRQRRPVLRLPLGSWDDPLGTHTQRADCRG